MIVWINGPFGVGKTTLAVELAARIENSFIFDPEEVGFMIRKLTPPSKQLADFQDYPLWRELVVKTILYATAESQLPRPSLGSFLFFKLTSSQSMATPEMSRIEVKLAASISVCFKAARQSKELPAKATIASVVRTIVWRFPCLIIACALPAYYLQSS